MSLGPIFSNKNKLFFDAAGLSDIPNTIYACMCQHSCRTDLRKMTRFYVQYPCFLPSLIKNSNQPSINWARTLDRWQWIELPTHLTVWTDYQRSPKTPIAKCHSSIRQRIVHNFSFAKFQRQFDNITVSILLQYVCINSNHSGVYFSFGLVVLQTSSDTVVRYCITVV